MTNSQTNGQTDRQTVRQRHKAPGNETNIYKNDEMEIERGQTKRKANHSKIAKSRSEKQEMPNPGG